jgi:hypothetical protein
MCSAHVTKVCRAKFIVESARIVRESGGIDWLYGLRQLPYEEARDQLLQLQGVGRKVADCVALFSLDKTDAVPVDTHVWDITQSLYAQHLQKVTKSLTPKMYDEIRCVWRETFGSHSGWAQAILFAGELTRFRQLLQDSGCSPALGLAIKEERKEAAGSLPNSPQKSKSLLKSEPAAGPPLSPAQTAVPESKRTPKVKQQQQLVGQHLEQAGAQRSDPPSFLEVRSSASEQRSSVMRLKPEETCGARETGAVCSAPASVSSGSSKRVKRERA